MRIGDARTLRQGVVLLSAVLIAVVGCRAAEPQNEERSVTYEVLDEEAQPLRDAFNADSSAVRVLMLASPT